MNVLLMKEFIRNNVKDGTINKNRLKIELLELIKYYYPSNLFPIEVYINDNTLYIRDNIYLEQVPIKNSNLIIKLYKKSNCDTLNLKIVDKANSIIILFEFFSNNLYPFQSPSQIKINNYNYINLLQGINRSFLEKVTNNSCCLCCRSIMCCNNWAPTIALKNILNEIYINMNYKKLYIYHLCLKVIVRKYLFEDAESIILYYLNMIIT